MKAHSERVPGKNIKLLDGKPLFFHIADTLRETEKFNLLAINTDSKEISKLATERYGDWVEVIERPKVLCGNYVPMNSIIAHDVDYLGINNDYLQTHSTNPLLRCMTIIDAVNQYFEGKSNKELDTLFSVNALHTRLYNKDLRAINHDPHHLIRTQDLEVVYEENSCFYIFSGLTFSVNSLRIGNAPKPFTMSRNSFESIDIDETTDWDFAQFIIKNRLYND